MTTAPTQDRIEVIDFLRGIAILAILAAHIVLFKGFLPVTLFDKLWYRLMANGGYGVNIFFVISGYVITRSIFLQRRKDSKFALRNFYVRRLARLGPLLLFIVVLGCVLMFAVKPAFPDAPWHFFGSPDAKFDALFCVSLFSFSLNWLIIFNHTYGLYWVVMWSLAIEEQFYLFYPILVRQYEKTGRHKAFFFLIIFVIVLGPFARWAEYLIMADHSPVFYNSFGNFDQLAWGCLLFFASEKWRAFFNSRHALKQIVLLSGALMLIWFYLSSFFFTFSLNRVLAPTLMAIGIWGIVLGGERHPFFETPLLRWITLMGRLSYGMYLFHPVVLFLLSTILIKLGMAPSLLLVLMSCTGLAWLSARYFEVPSKLWVIRTLNPGNN